MDKPTKEDLERDAYKKRTFDDGSKFYCTEYGCFTLKDGVVEEFKDKRGNKSNWEIRFDKEFAQSEICLQKCHPGDKQKILAFIHKVESEAEERGAKKMIKITKLIKKHKDELKELGL